MLANGLYEMRAPVNAGRFDDHQRAQLLALGRVVRIAAVGDRRAEQTAHRRHLHTGVVRLHQVPAG